MYRVSRKLIVLTLFLVMAAAIPVMAHEFSPAEIPAPEAIVSEAAPLASSQVVSITILHTNDFHGNLEADYKGRGGSAYMATVITDTRNEKGADNVVLLDAGDIFFGAPPISQLLMGESAIDIYNMMGYDVAAFGNHEFDKGQDVLITRTQQSNFPWVGANIVVSGTNWEHPDWVNPYVTLTVGSPVSVTLGIIGVDTDETPLVTLKGTTEGLVFMDMTEAILHYYDEVMAQSDAVLVLAHMGTNDSGEFKGLATVARELVEANKPVDLMIAGHQHQVLDPPVVISDTVIAGAGYYGRYLGQLEVTIDPALKALNYLTHTMHTINDTLTPTQVISDRVAYWAGKVVTQTQQVVGHTNIELTRDYNNESIMGDLVADSMLWKADEYDDGEVNGSVDIAFTNPGGLRADIDIPDGATLPYTLTWEATFNVLPFANTLFLMDLTGAQIQELLDQSAKLYKGILQSAGVTYYWYNDDADAYEPTPTAWGAYDVMVGGEPLERDKVYRVVTNNFLAGGQDGWVTFAEGTNRWDTYFDMQVGLNEYLDTLGTLDASDIEMGRITLLDKVVTILHTNDVHGTFPASSYYGNPQGMVYIASHIAAERAKNPNAVLLDAGDIFQGNSFAQYFRNDDPNPIAEGMNLLEYDAMVLGNHEYNFGPATFAMMLGQLEFPILGSANVDDDGSYGFINENVKDYITMTVDGMDITVFGLTNPNVPRYELPSNIEGLSFYAATATAQTMVPQILEAEDPDLFVALTHIGYDVYGDDEDCDKRLAELVPGIDVIVGGHSHTRLNPAVIVTSTTNPTGTLVGHAGSHASYLGKINIGFTGTITDGYDMVLREGILLSASEVPTNAEMSTLLAPFVAALEDYTSEVIGITTVAIDALEAYTEETNGANLQVDASIWELEQNGVDVDFHLSGAMSNRRVPSVSTPVFPYQLTVDDMYTLMPYENSLVAIEMTGPQIKRVLERSYRNWYYYNYVDGYGGYSHYTTCMLDTNEGNQIIYRDTHPTLPDGNNVLALMIDGEPVDFSDETTTYNVSTVNYLAAGACNFSDSGETLWPLDQVVTDTQFYVRDAVIDYIKDKGTISPMVEGRLQFLTSTPDLSTSTKDVVDASGDGVAESGEILTYTITITNSGTYGAGFILTDTLPTGMTYVADSLDYTFPGTGFTATVTSNVLTAHTEGYLNPPTGASLYMPGVATLTFAAEVGDVEGTEIVNTAELVGDYQYWSLSATIPVEAGYNIYLPVIMKN